jgi:hypothetical protein
MQAFIKDLWWLLSGEAKRDRVRIQNNIEKLNREVEGHAKECERLTQELEALAWPTQVARQDAREGAEAYQDALHIEDEVRRQRAAPNRNYRHL